MMRIMKRMCLVMSNNESMNESVMRMIKIISIMVENERLRVL